MKMTSIQLSEKTKKKLDSKKVHPRESYEDVIKRTIDEADIPNIKEMFKLSDKLKEGKTYSTEEVIRLTHKLRNKK